METTLDFNHGFSASHLQKKLLQTVNPVIGTALARFKYTNWCDMKFDPSTGKNSYEKNKWYNKDKVYSWIQGRELETIVRTLEFNSSISGYNLFDEQELKECGKVLYEKLLPFFGDWTKENHSSSRVPFILSPDFDKTEKKIPSLSDITVLRGLLAWANYSEAPEKTFLIENMRFLCNSIFMNDKIDFTTGIQFTNIVPNRMIVIGSAMLLYEATGNSDDLKFAIEAINEDMSFTQDPGNTMEIVGMGLELLRKYGSKISNCKTIQKELIKLGLEEFEKAQTPNHTICQSIDLKTGKPTGSISPWWSSFETTRALAEIFFLENTDETLKKLINHFDSVKQNYLNTPTLIPIQTVDYNGKPIDSIPATPDIDPGFHTCIPLYDTYLILSKIATIQAGIAALPIKLKMGVRLQGHTARIEGADGVLDPLYVHTCIIKTSFDIFAVISTDLIELDERWVKDLYKAIEIQFKIKQNNITISTTHIHTGPCAIELEGLIPDKDLYTNLEDAVLLSVASALSKTEVVEIKSGVTEIQGIGINRRVIVGNNVMMKPNITGDIDKKLNLVGFFDQEGTLKGLMAQLALHPTTLGVAIHKFSADYLGPYYSGIKEQFDVPIIVLQGACGDTRPAILSEDKKNFTDGDESDCQMIGEKLLEGTSSIIESWKNQKAKVVKMLNLNKKTIGLNLELPTKSEVERLLADSREELLHVDELTKDMDAFTKAHDCTALSLKETIAWSQKWLVKEKEGKLKDTILSDFALMEFDDELKIAFLPGEAFTSIGENLRKKFDGTQTLICGYYSGSVGYLPNEKAFDEGGYEVERAFRSYGFSGPFDRKIETQVYDVFDELKKQK